MTTNALTPNYNGYLSNSSFQIYVSSLSDYNNGILHGVYIDVEKTTEDDAHALISQMLTDSPTAKRYGDKAEEYAIHDYNVTIEGFDRLKISELSNINTIFNAYDVIRQLKSKGYDLLPAAEYLEHVTGDNDIEGLANLDIGDFTDAFRGHYKSEEDFAYEYAEDSGIFAEMPEYLHSYFDIKKYARDLFIGDFCFTDSGHVFSTF